MRLLVCIVTHRPPEICRPVIDFVLKTCSESQVLLINNGRDPSDFPPCDTFLNPRVVIMHIYVNVGHTGGTNFGIKYAFEKGYDFFLKLDDDMRFITEDWYQKCIDLMNFDKDMGVIGAKVLNPDGKTVQQCCSRLFPSGLWYNFGEPREKLELQRIVRVSCIPSTFWFMRVEHMRKVGYMDLLFSPAQGDDTDYCWRMWQSGLSCVYDGRIEVVHYWQSQKEHPERNLWIRSHFAAQDLKYKGYFRFGLELEEHIDKLGREIVLPHQKKK